MGGKSSSSNKTSTKNTSSQNAISGDNLGVALSGIEGSTINATVTPTTAALKSRLTLQVTRLMSRYHSPMGRLKSSAQAIAKTFK